MTLPFLHLIMKSAFSIVWHGNLCPVNQISHCVLKKYLDPSRLMVFLGVELSSVDMEARLPAEKLDKYREKLTDFAKYRKTTLENMQSVIECLQFATSVIIPGRAFVRRLVDTTIGVKKPSHFVTLNDGTTVDIKMWLTFFQFHNGKTIFIQPEAESSISLHMYTDASKQACAATFKSSWFVIGFPVDWQGKNIAFLELYLIVVALQIFGIRLANRAVVFHCDNKAIVQIINKQSSRDKCIMGLVRHLVMTAMQYNINFSSKHVEGKKNILADKLSRLQVTSHLLSSFGVSPYPTSVPARLQPSDYRPLWSHWFGLQFSPQLWFNIGRCGQIFAIFAAIFYSRIFILPVNSGNLGLYVSHLADLGLQPTTIQSHLSAIRFVHKMHDCPDPTQSFLITKLMIALHKKSTCIDKRRPITLPLLMTFIPDLNIIQNTAYHIALYSAMYSLAYFACLRVGELATSNNMGNVLDLGQVAQVSLEGELWAIQISFSQYKHSGGDKPILELTRQTDDRYCPVKLLQKYLALRPSGPGPVFVSTLGKPISRQQFYGLFTHPCVFDL